MRKAIGTAATVAVMLGTLGAAGTASASSPAETRGQQISTTSAEASGNMEANRLRCGATIKRLSNGPGPLGNKRWNIYYKNCSSSAKKRKVDIKLGRDLVCKKIKPGKTAKWHHRTGHFGPDSPRSVKKC
ncbi:hypothetical protein ACFQVC_11280 [Streptomyces monticola]|uniref:Secreted protein n=1 Tax=Streptomyces monticola TaxID=2666263 RepID=A0ABW2JFH8_9ACTN